jgi:hypothetical protein
MSILLRIAERADVAVEGVVRVLENQPVSRAIEERVLAVLQDLDADDAEAVRRLGLLRARNVVAADSTGIEPAPRADAAKTLTEVTQTLDPEPDRELASSLAARTNGGAGALDLNWEAMQRLADILEELVVSVREIKHEGSEERHDRLQDLAVLVELITTGWQGVDRRLARLERITTRLEAGSRTSDGRM